MDCESYINLMSDYIEGDLDADALRQWEEHFNACPPCKEFFGSFQSMVHSVALLKRHACPQTLRMRLSQMIQERASSSGSAR